MYWGFKGHEIDERSMRDNIIYKLGSFLISQPDFFYFTMDVLIACKKRTNNNRIYDLNRIEHRLRALAITNNRINKNTNYYLELLKEYNDEKVDKGKLMDYIVYKIGPYKLGSEDHQNSHENNALYAEIIECKIDINTFVHSPPSNKDSFSDDAKRKLGLMQYINQRKRNRDSISFYFATFRKNVNSCRQVLKAYGYDFVQILSGDDLFEMLKRFRVGQAMA